VTQHSPLLSRRDLVRRETYQPDAQADYWLRVYRQAMACRFEVILAGEDAHHLSAARAALDRVDNIETRLTVFRNTSALMQLNRTAANGPVSIGTDLLYLLLLCQEVHEATEAAFDITSAPLSRCWGFLRRQGGIPSNDDFSRALERVGMQHVVIEADAGTVMFDRPGIELNLGAIGKGWALDRVADTLQMTGVNALLSAGRSSVRAVTPAAQTEAAPAGWLINLTSPRLEKPIGRVTLRHGAVGTSGAGEQFFEVDGKRYGHIIDPRTGWPTEGALSVSVLAAEAAVADALSTAFFVGGIDLARRYCDQHPFVQVIFTPDDDERRAVVVGSFPWADVELT
jgi:FAD:protein FMN transferase